MMTRKDYIAVAKIINDYYDDQEGIVTIGPGIIDELAQYMQSDNPLNFDPLVFEVACGRKICQAVDGKFKCQRLNGHGILWSKVDPRAAQHRRSTPTGQIQWD